MTKKRIALLGSTGSIGTQTLDVVRTHPDSFEVVTLATGSNAALLERQMAEFVPRHVGLISGDGAGSILSGHPGFRTGPDVFVELASLDDADIVVVATTGAVGLLLTMAALEVGKRVTIANKEVLVMAGDLVMAAAEAHGGELIPIDSEHSAILQCLEAGRHEEVEQIILTSSGGPFRGKALAEIADATVKDALNHPTWSMGKKITIDSATLFNKGLEIIEAHHLFRQPYDRIHVVVHPQSIVHSMVEFRDGSILAQLGDTDMRTPIQFALSFPDRLLPSARRLHVEELTQLTFEAPDPQTFPCLRLAREAGVAGGTLPAFASVANEELVDAFLNGRIRFGQIPALLEQAMERHEVQPVRSIPAILDVDLEARRITQELIDRSGTG